MNESGHSAYKTEHSTYQMQHIAHKVDGFEYGIHIFRCNMNYIKILYFGPFNNFTGSTQ